MNTTPSTAKRPFAITIQDAATGQPKVVETVEVEVTLCNGDEFLTPESSALIDSVRARHLGLMTGKDIKAMRERLKLSQRELTDLLQCGEKSLSRWENGRGQPTGLVNTMLRLLDEGFIAPASLRAVQGARSSRWSPSFSAPAAARKSPLHYAMHPPDDINSTDCADKALAA